jgi:hypothetical protein
MATFMRDGVAAFLQEYPSKPPSCVALYCSPVNGWVSLCIDTVDHGAAPETSCPDFSHSEYRLLEQPDWSQEYESADPVVQRHDSVAVRLKSGDGDEVFNEPFFLLLMKISNDYYHHANKVFRPTWAGVRILDSEFASFWRVQHGANNA